MKTKKQPTRVIRSQEVVHVGFTAPVYKLIKQAATDEHRTITNFIQTAVIEALQARGYEK